MVVVKRKPSRPARPGVSRAPMTAIKQYRLALRNPFSPDALGVRAVDSICYPTAVSHIRYKLSCTSTAGGTFSMVILPFIHANSILQLGTASGSPGTYAANPSVGVGAFPSVLKTLYSQFRIVTWGARIILTDSNQSAKGTYTVAPVMLGGYVPGENILGQPAVSSAVLQQCFGIQNFNESITGLPGAVAVNAQDLMANGELVMRGLPYSVTAYDMKPLTAAAVNWNVNQTVSQPPTLIDSVVTSSLGEASGCGDARGQIGYCLYAANLPPSTQEFQIEFIYHLEAVPLANLGSVVTTSTPSPPGSTHTVEQLLAAMNTAGEYFALGTNIAERLGNLGTRMYQFRNAARRKM